MFSARGGFIYGSPDLINQFIGGAVATAPGVARIYRWEVAGFGTILTGSPVVAGQATGIEFTKANDAFAVSHAQSPYISAFAFDSANSVIGSKFSDPTSSPPTIAGRSVAFDQTDSYLAYGTSDIGVAGEFGIYNWNSSTGFGTKKSSVALSISDGAFCIIFDQTDSYVAFARTSTVDVYPWSSSGLGTKYTNPSPFNVYTSVDFTSSSNAIASGYTVYAWSVSGFGVKFSDPATIPSTISIPATKFSKDDSAIGIGFNAGIGNSPSIFAYPWSGSGFGTKYSDPTSSPEYLTQEISFSKDNNSLGSAQATANNAISAWQWSSSGWGSRYTSPSGFATGTNDIQFTN